MMLIMLRKFFSCMACLQSETTRVLLSPSDEPQVHRRLPALLIMAFIFLSSSVSRSFCFEAIEELLISFAFMVRRFASELRMRLMFSLREE